MRIVGLEFGSIETTSSDSAATAMDRHTRRPWVGLDGPLERHRWLRRARYAQAIISGAIGVALAVALLQALSVVDAVFRTVAAGEGERLLHHIRVLGRPGEPLSAAALRTVLEREGQNGLRCIATFDAEGHVALRLGQCETNDAGMEAALRDFRPGEVVRRGARFRMVHRLPPAGRMPPILPESADLRPPPRPFGNVEGGPPHPHSQAFLIEFLPRQGDELRATTLRSVLMGIAASFALVVAVVVFWRISVRAERLQHAAERDRRFATLGEMSAVLAHEIRNPLASLKGHAQLLMETLPPDSRSSEKARRIVGEAVRLESLCEDLLSLVRSNRVERVDVSPASLLRAAAAAVDDGRFEIDTSQAPSRWPLDPLRMHQVLTNLLRNGLQASPEGRSAQARVYEEGNVLVFAVRDFGSGIDAGEAARIFEPFHTTKVRGTGLGLAVARRIVELHGGTITVRNHMDGGADFRVTVPKSAPQ